MFRKIEYGEVISGVVLQDLLLIQRKTGFLINHLSNVPGWKLRKKKQRAELISGMLTAVKGFIEQFLTDDNSSDNGELKEIVHSDHIIKIDTGPNSILAVVIKMKNDIPNNFESEIKEFHRTLYSRYEKEIELFDGSQKKDSELNREISGFFRKFSNK